MIQREQGLPALQSSFFQQFEGCDVQFFLKEKAEEMVRKAACDGAHIILLSVGNCLG